MILPASSLQGIVWLTSESRQAMIPELSITSLHVCCVTHIITKLQTTVIPNNHGDCPLFVSEGCHSNMSDNTSLSIDLGLIVWSTYKMYMIPRGILFFSFWKIPSLYSCIPARYKKYTTSNKNTLNCINKLEIILI